MCDCKFVKIYFNHEVQKEATKLFNVVIIFYHNNLNRKQVWPQINHKKCSDNPIVLAQPKQNTKQYL